MKIAVLPAALANQIAAGEVVERPASAIKELVENALDAGATRCDVSVEGGGITRLSVKDNGCGMTAKDAALSLLRHATSKLQDFEGLSHLLSFGFRGEALPSIASVSRLALRTRPIDGNEGVELRVEAGASATQKALSMAPGTEVEVLDLFYNVPARRKFLRSSATETGYITEVLEAAALARPDVTFTLERDGKRAREWLRVSKKSQRVAQIIGDDDLAACHGERGPLSLEAFLDRPERARATAGAVRILCNGRPIRDRAMLHAVAQSYGSVLERGRYPRGVIYLELPSELVDVNVHPQKTEVRFADGRAVCDAVFQILSAELGRAFSLPTVSPNRWGSRTSVEHSASPSLRVGDAPTSPGLVTTGSLTSGPLTPAQLIFLQTASAHADSLADSAPMGTPQTGVSRAAGIQRPLWQTLERVDSLGRAALDSGRTPAPSGQELPEAQSVSAEDTAAPMRRLAEDGAPPVWAALRFAGQLRQTFLVCEDSHGYYLLDQHAAAERVNFDRLKKAYTARASRSQALLFPVLVDVSRDQLEALESFSAEIEQLGFEIQRRTESSVSVHRVPALLKDIAAERVAVELLQEFARQDRQFSERVDLALATLACHGSLRAGQAVSEREARTLLADLDAVEFAGHCPHGRPIVSFTPWSELERRVGRR